VLKPKLTTVPSAIFCQPDPLTAIVACVGPEAGELFNVPPARRMRVAACAVLLCMHRLAATSMSNARTQIIVCVADHPGRPYCTGRSPGHPQGVALLYMIGATFSRPSLIL
jgi:hypothetical protein